MNRSKSLFLLALTIVCSGAATYSQTVVDADQLSGVQVEQEEMPPYDELPQEYRDIVSREKYEQMAVSAFQSASQIIEEAEYQKACQRAIGFSIRNLNQAMAILETLSNNSRLADEVNFLLDQKAEFADLKNAYLEAKAMLESDGKNLAKLDQEYARKLADILTRSQLAKIGEWRTTQIGVPKVLTETAIGEAIELSKQQKEDIRAGSQRIANEIKEFLNAKRKEAAELSYNVLDNGQKEKLLKIISSQELDRANNVSIERLWNFLDYSERPNNLFKLRSIEIDESSIWNANR